MASTHLDSIERLQFDDGTLAFDFDGTAGQAYRLYQAAFDPAPDAERLAYWLSYLDNGKLDVDAIAALFEASAEFIRLYGDADSGSDADGFAFWQNTLDSGAIDRGDALAFFPESSENVDRVLPTVADGM